MPFLTDRRGQGEAHMDDSWKVWVRLACFLALALVMQSIRLVVPLPGPVNMFFIGSLLNAVMILSIWQTGSCRACIIGLILPVGAFLQGQLPLVLMIPVIALGNICYMVWAHVFRRSRTAVFAGPVLKAGILYGGTQVVLLSVALPAAAGQTLSFMMSWPQVVTGCAGIVLAGLVRRRL